MPEPMPKNYDPAAVQAEIQAQWDREKPFAAVASDAGEPYAIVIPPPNVTAALHLGHALNNTLQDILVRRARMQGKNAVWIPGTDHAGIATQTVVEKRVLKEEGRRRVDFDREEFVGKIQAWKDEYEKVILGQLKAMGCSCDWDRTAFTMDEPRAKAVREAFFQLFKSGLIYRGKRLVNWDPATLTALADDEVEMEEVDGFFYYLRYPLTDGSGHVTVATTRPETMLGDTAVAINPKDPRAASLRGKTVKLPLVGREIPIIEDDYVVLPVSLGGDPADTKAQMATGYLKVTPAHDTNDYDIGQRHSLPVINVFAPDATISNQHGWTDIGDAGFLLGQSREAAREAIVAWFKNNGLLEDAKPYRHSVGHSYRSHVAIEPYLSDQWYIAMSDVIGDGDTSDTIPETEITDRNSRLWRKHNASQPKGTGSNPALPRESLAGRALLAVLEKRINFSPERYSRTFETWNSGIRDWCISRQLWWGHRIPVWSFTAESALDGKEDAKLSSLIEQLIRLKNDGRVVLQHGTRKSEAAPIDLADSFICVRETDDTPAIKLLELLGFTQDSDVLDTWFSSGLWPMSTLGWPEKTPDLQTWNPTSVLCTAREIITLWVSRMTMFNKFFLGRVPFKDVFIHAMIQDGDGRKMSKSLGNGVDPLDIIASHGTDAMRFTLTSMATNTQDVRMPVIKDETTGKNTSAKFDFGRGFCNKLWSIARFVFMAIEGIAEEAIDELKWSTADRWIVSRLNRTIAEIDEALANYRFDQYARSIYAFVENDFSGWYVEFAKPQLKDEKSGGQTAAVLASVMDATIRLLQPAIPFITEKLWQSLNETRPTRGLPGRIDCPAAERITKAQWPRVGDVSQAAEHIFPRVQELITAVRNLRGEQKVEPKRVIELSIYAPEGRDRQIASLQPAIEQLTSSKIVLVEVAPTDGMRLTVAGCELSLAGLRDVVADAARSLKRRGELEKEIAAMRGRLANEAYIAKAPAKLVAETNAKLAAAEAELASLGV